MFGNKSMDDMPKVDPFGGSDSESSSDQPVTRAEFDALAARVEKCEKYVDQDEQDDEQGDDDSMTSSSIAGASKSVKPTMAAKSMVGMMGANPLKKSKPPFSS